MVMRPNLSIALTQTLNLGLNTTVLLQIAYCRLRMLYDGTLCFHRRVSVQVDVRGGGYPSPRFFPGLLSRVLSRRWYSSSRFFPRPLGHVLCQMVPQSWPEGIPEDGHPQSLQMGYPPARSGWGTSQARSGWGTPWARSVWDTHPARSGWDTHPAKSGWDTHPARSGWDTPWPG